MRGVREEAGGPQQPLPPQEDPLRGQATQVPLLPQVTHSTSVFVVYVAIVGNVHGH